MSRAAVLVPSLGSPHLDTCLEAVEALEPRPDQVVVVLSGRNWQRPCPSGVEVVRSAHRLGFAAAVNAGMDQVENADVIALLNDDAVPAPHWLATLADALEADEGLAAVQGTVRDATGQVVDGRGIGFDGCGLPIQVDRGSPADPEPAEARPLVAVSGTAALFRRLALDLVALWPHSVFDPAFGSYHEDLDLGLRLTRLGWRSAWVPGAACRHLGSATGRGLRWRHPWWVLANRWRALAGNLRPATLVRCLPHLLRGEVRAVHTLLRDNPRTLAVAVAVAAAWPFLVSTGLGRRSRGDRLDQPPWSAPCG